MMIKYEPLINDCLKKMEFEWDADKAEGNLRKHGVNFAEAVSVLKDGTAITVYDEHPLEDRYITIGMSDIGQLLVVVYSLRHNRFRLISARKANKRERKQYFS